MNGQKPSQFDFGQTISYGEYRPFSSTKGQINSGIVPASGVLEPNVFSGNYIVELVIDRCTYPTESYTIADRSQVAFSIPADFFIRKNIEFTPKTTEYLVFMLTYPDGSSQA